MLILTLFAMAPVGVSNATAVANPADESFRRYDEAKIHPSSNRPVSSGMGMRAVSRVLGIHHKTLSLVGASYQSTPSEPTADRGLLLHRSRSALSSLKKVPMLALASGRLHLWQGPKALSVEGGRSQPVRSFGSRSSICRRWAMARTC